MLKFVIPNHLKTKSMCKNAIKKLVFIMKYVPDWYNTKEICDKVFWNDGILGFISDCYKNKKICGKAVDHYSSPMQFVPVQYKIHEMCDNAVDTYLCAFDSVPDRCKTQELCDKVVSKEPFVLLKCWFDIYKGQKMSDKLLMLCYKH